MNFPIKWFAHDMPGAPVVTGHPGAITGLLDTCLLNGWGLVQVDALHYDSSADEVTATVSGGHGFVQHQVVLLSGANEAEFNGEQRVTWVSSTAFKFTPIAPPQVEDASGTLTAKVAPVGHWQKKFASADGLKGVYQSTSPHRRSEAALYIDDSNTSTDPQWDYSGVNAVFAAYETIADLESRNGLINAVSKANVLRKAYSTSASYMDAAKPWYLIADERFVYLLISSNLSYLSFDGAFFGEMISYKPEDDHAYVICAHTSSNSSSRSPSSFAVMDYADVAIRLQRSYTGLEGAIATKQYGMKLGGGNEFGSEHTAGAVSPVDGGLHLSDRIYMMEDEAKVLRGELPGLGHPLHKNALMDGAIFQAPWRGGQHLLLAVPLSGRAGNSYAASYRYQMLFDITGGWRV